MSPLANSTFFTTLDPLPKETIVWEGKASKKARKMLMLQTLLCLVLLIVLSAPIFSVFAYGNKMEKQTAEERQLTEAPASEHPRHAEMPPWFFIFIIFSALCFVGSIFALMLFIISISSFFRIPYSNYIVTSERICIQQGRLNKSIAAIDLDKVISLKATSSWFQRKFSLYTVEVIHAGSGNFNARGPFTGFPSTAYTIEHVDLDLNILSKMVNIWLPRDNRSRT